jgi:hypothetical protein
VYPYSDILGMERKPEHEQAAGRRLHCASWVVAQGFSQQILLGQVVDLNTYDSERCVLYLTDFTENEQLVDYKNTVTLHILGMERKPEHEQAAGRRLHCASWVVAQGFSGQSQV